MAKPAGIEWAERFIDDVKERQVNTIITDGISGRAMTHPVRGLCEIANTYAHKLSRAGFLDVSKLPEGHPAVGKKGGLKGNHHAFELLKKAAEQASKGKLKDDDDYIFQRIVSTSRELESVAHRLEPANPDIDWDSALASHERLPEPQGLTMEDRMAIVKAWEIGTSVVVMQTTIGLDGDLVTRVTRNHLGPSSAVVRQLHDDSVRTSISTWESLVKGILRLARAAID